VDIDIRDISATLARQRKKQHLSQVSLAKRMGIPQSQVSRAESGADMRVSTLRDIARALGLDVVLVPLQALPVIAAAVGDAREEAPRFAASSERDPE
jgi:HTH-type transcriptional regulator/antitoxin HipB